MMHTIHVVQEDGTRFWKSYRKQQALQFFATIVLYQRSNGILQQIADFRILAMNLYRVHSIYTPSERINIFLVNIDKTRLLNDLSQKPFYFIVIHFISSIFKNLNSLSLPKSYSRLDM